MITQRNDLTQSREDAELRKDWSADPDRVRTTRLATEDCCGAFAFLCVFAALRQPQFCQNIIQRYVY